MKKLPLDYIKTFGSTAGDDQFAKVTALFNFDGSDGDTTTSGLDASNKNLTLSYSSGDQLSNTQKKFGATSLYVADNVTVSSSDGFNMGTGDFTIEGWYYLTQFNNQFLYDQWSSSSTGAGNNQIYVKSTDGGSIRVYYDGSGKFTTTGGFSLNTWTHLAVVRYSNTITVYFNGTADGTTQSYSGQFGKTGDLYIGDQHAGGGGAPQMYVDDLRGTKGLARYTSNFTAPTTAHLSSAGDSLKNIIVNEDADGVIIGTSGISTTRIAKAWVNFNGTGTVAIRSSYNVSSITDDATGKYDVNFSTAMSDNDYSVVSDGRYDTGDSAGSSICTVRREALTTSKFGVRGANVEAATFSDFEMVSAIVFGN